MDIVILGLAVWRLASLLASERGPGAIFDRVRRWCGVQYTTDELGNDIVITNTELSKLVSCPWCNSVWLGAIASLAYLIGGEVAVWLATPLALSAIAILANSIVERAERGR